MKKLLFYASAVAVLFSSCSQDATEDIAVQSGHKVFTASINVEDEAQTRLELNGNTYVWQVNDAIGVASKDNKDANILVSNTVSGTMPAFSVTSEDYNRWLNIAEATTQANPLYVYFPYKANTVFELSGSAVNVDLTIPEVQRYAEGSFYRNTVPAVGYIAEYNGSETNVDLKVPTALLRVKIAGFGDAKNVSMKIKSAAGTYYKLAGTSKVNVAPVLKAGKTNEYEEYAPAFAEPTENTSEMVTVDFGNLPETLKYNGMVDIHFVIPAGLDLSGATLEFSIDKFATGTEVKTHTFKVASEHNKNAYKTKANVRTNVGNEANPKVISFGMSNKFMVDSAEAFLAYAYLSRPNVSNLAANPTASFIADYAYAAEMMGIEIKTTDDYKKVAAVEALLVADIDFANYGKEWADAKLAAIEEETAQNDGSDFWYNALTWYKGNDYAIEPLSYNAIYGFDSQNPCTIKNLTVLGSGLTEGADLSNLVLENITVNAKVVKNSKGELVWDSKQTSNVGLIAGEANKWTVSYGGTPNAIVIDNVTIGEGNVVNAGLATYIGGLFGYVADTTDAKSINIKEAAPITINVTPNPKGWNYNPTVGRLFGLVEKPMTLKLDGKFSWSATQTALPVIGRAWATIEADKAQSTTMKNAGVVGSTAYSDATPSSASVIVEGVSYWNGAYVAPDSGNTAFTAEELAYVLSRDNSANFTLTNDIDMQCFRTTTSEQVVDIKNFNYSTYNVDTTVKTAATASTAAVYNVFEIKNVIADATGVPALFGGEGNVSNVNFTNVVINGAATATDAAGLAVKGIAKNVVIDGLVINVAKAAALKNVGGVFATATDKSIAGAGVEVKSFILNYEGTAKPAAGVVAGKLEVELTKEPMTLGITKLTGAQSQNVYKTIGNAQTKVELASYGGTKSYSYHYYPYGTVHVKNAQFAPNGVVNAVLNANEASVGVANMDKLAAGIVFTWTGTAAKQVSITEGEFKDYTVKTNKAIGNSTAASMFWGFTDKAPVAAN